MKKGFTLAELLGVLVLLGVVGLIVFPIITETLRENKEDLYNAQIEEIKLAAEKWAYENIELLPIDEGDEITINLETLKKSGFIGIDIRNPKTSELFSNNMLITITYSQNDYEFSVSGENENTLINDYNENAPILVLNGGPVEYVEIFEEYVDKGVVARDKDGKKIEATKMYQSNGVEVTSVNTSTFKTYLIIYTSNSNGYTSSITRTVIVRDTKAPELNIPENVEITLEAAKHFSLLKDVTATDNSGEVIRTQVSGFDATLGEKIVSYTACDSNNNCVVKKRIINIVE